MKKRGRKIIGKSLRVPSSFTIESHIVVAFKAHCKARGISASFFVQQKMEEFLADVKKEEK